MLKTARDEVVLPYWRKLIDAIKDLATQYRDAAALPYPRPASDTVHHG
jgi:adenylosuccinate lyase